MSAVEELLPWMPVQIRSLLSGEFGEWQDDEIVDEIERMYARPGRPVSVRTIGSSSPRWPNCGPRSANQILTGA
jgi:hypothetical protein